MNLEVIHVSEIRSNFFGVAHGLVFINSAHGRLPPIYAIKLESVGDISLAEDKTSNDSIVWSVRRGGSYRT